MKATALLCCIAAALFVGASANWPASDGDYFQCNDQTDPVHYGKWWSYHFGFCFPCAPPPPACPVPIHYCSWAQIGYPVKAPYKCFQANQFYCKTDDNSKWWFDGNQICPCKAGTGNGPWGYYDNTWFDLYQQGPEHDCGGGGGGGGGPPPPVVCFPAEATAQLESGETVTMENLDIGDRVLVNKPDGSLAYEDVYLFGHREAKEVASYLSISLEGSAAQLTLSGLHYLPVGADRRMTRAEDVTVGQTVWAAASGELAPFRVSEIATSLKRGMYNPFTMGGTIVVDGVAASSHSDWFLDAVTPKSLTTYLPAIYQATLAPARLAYNILGAEVAKEMDAKFDFAAEGAKGGILPYASTFAKVVAAAATSTNKA